MGPTDPTILGLVFAAAAIIFGPFFVMRGIADSKPFVRAGDALGPVVLTIIAVVGLFVLLGHRSL